MGLHWQLSSSTVVCVSMCPCVVTPASGPGLHDPGSERGQRLAHWDQSDTSLQRTLRSHSLSSDMMTPDNDPWDMTMTTLYDLSSLPATFSMMASPSARNRRRQQAAGTEERQNIRTIIMLFSSLNVHYLYVLILPPSVRVLSLNKAKYFYSGE